ncbi:sulfatase family protein [Albibacterium indicum]|uniref:sulfatase family protein n=1 Tax=Albibacterium indicum TaxID=2292082 RepID=UPI000E4F2EEE|nr:sulfatase-like hydrolase/transferase [Pedobacter indicus]
MKYLYFLLGALFLSMGAFAQSKPNIILIISDDQGYNDIGVYGNKVIKTPHLDQLANDGVRLTNFYVTGSGCTPSRGSLLTGRYPQRNGTFELFRNNMVDYGHNYTDYEYSVSPERILGTDLREVYIPTPLKEAGYVSGYFGKWDLGQLKRYLPLQRGFDEFYGFANTGIDYYKHERYGVPSMLDGNTPTTEDKGTYTTDLFENKARDFIEKHSGKPFFLYLAFNAPHGASSLDPDVRGLVQAPEEFQALYPKGKTKAEERKRSHMAAVSKMDDAIGNLLQLLKDKGLEENTIVIFLSDNGGTGVADNSPLRGRKAQFFEGGIRVPCIIKWPGTIDAGLVNNDFLSSMEIFPTLLSAAGVALPDSIVYDGFDMIDILKGKVKNERDEMFWEFRGEQAARVDHWKWMKRDSSEYLFDLSKDISETNNLVESQPDVVKMVKGKFANWQKSMAEAEPRGPFKDF